jgi:hypothetical protein
MLLLVAHEGRSANNQLIKNLVEIIFPLICGIYNGLAMGLLFGRFISMEFYFKEIYENQSWLSRILYNYGVVFLLPIYVLAQPMYGLLKLDTFERLGSFEGIVFLVCFMGKSIFLLVMYAYLTSKLLHVYLHLLVANHGIPKSLAEIFPQIGRSDSVTVIESNGQDPEPVQVSLAEQEIISPYLINVEGKFDYECINHDNQHRHGGECNIELITNSDNILELRMIGLRCWQKDNTGPKIMVDPPMRWDTNKGVIFKDRTYMYSFLIILPKGSSVGVSKGDVRLSTDGKFIEQFSGTYFQQLGDQIFLGSELFTKKATFPFIENAAAANSV